MAASWILSICPSAADSEAHFANHWHSSHVSLDLIVAYFGHIARVGQQPLDVHACMLLTIKPWPQSYLDRLGDIPV
jgi:hypothetical protein